MSMSVFDAAALRSALTLAGFRPGAWSALPKVWPTRRRAAHAAARQRAKDAHAGYDFRAFDFVTPEGVLAAKVYVRTKGAE